jgi:hypothetical protein
VSAINRRGNNRRNIGAPTGAVTGRETACVFYDRAYHSQPSRLDPNLRPPISGNMGG